MPSQDSMLQCLTRWRPTGILLWIAALLLLRVALVTLLLLRISTCKKSQDMSMKQRSCPLCRTRAAK